MNAILLLKLAHVLGAAVLFGTGVGIAFFMLMAHRTRDPATIARACEIVVIADTIFTGSAVMLQPVTGFFLAQRIGYSIFESWILVALGLYVLVGLCWLPVVWIQVELRDLAGAAARAGQALPKRYDRLFQVWFALGWPAFTGVIAIYALMLWRPQLW